MPVRMHVLVVANRTVDSPELISALKERAEEGPIHVTLVAPVAWAEREDAQERLAEAVEQLKAGGIEAEGMLGDVDPIAAVHEAWDPGRYDEVIVSTLAGAASRWMQIDLPHRVAKLTDCTVRHVEARSVPPPSPPSPPPPHKPLLDSALGLLRTSTRASRNA